MSLIRFNPKMGRTTLPTFFDDFFGKSISDIMGSDFTSHMPSVNIIEENDMFRIELAAPGLDKGDFDIQIQDDRMTISARKEAKKEEVNEGKFMRREFNFQSFSRSFYLPEDVNQEDISANYENGVLSIELKKMEEAAKPSPKVIEIK